MKMSAKSIVFLADIFDWLSKIIKAWTLGIFLMGFFIWCGLIEGEINLQKLTGVVLMVGALCMWERFTSLFKIAKEMKEEKKEDEMECEAEWKI